jgi:hypothetical protein
MKMIWLLASFLMASCATAGSSPPAPESNPAVTNQMALKTATNEIQRRRFVLPIGYEAEVIDGSYKAEVGPETPLFNVTFFAGRKDNRIQLYLVTIDKITGEVDFVGNELSTEDSNLSETPFAVTAEAALRTATNEIRKRALVLPPGYKTRVVKSIIFPKVGHDRPVFFVKFVRGAKGLKQFYQVAVNRNSGNIEFVLDFRAGTMD